MKFQELLESEAPRVGILGDGSIIMVKYGILKAYIAGLDTSGSGEQNSTTMIDGDCSICFEPFHSSPRSITTKCGHSFHPTCLIRSLGFGACSSCPLCRCKSMDLMPDGIDGDCLRFLAMVLVNTKAVEQSFHQALGSVEERYESLQQAFESAMGPAAAGGRPDEPLSTIASHARESLLAQAEQALTDLDAMLKFAELNREGLRKIL